LHQFTFFVCITSGLCMADQPAHRHFKQCEYFSVIIYLRQIVEKIC
jgi:hypothetical protein